MCLRDVAFPSATIEGVSTQSVAAVGPAPILRVEDLCIRFGEREVVHNISFEMAAGEALGLVGESGSGKSATSLAVLRLLPPEAHVTGRVLLAAAGDTRKDMPTDLLTLPERAMRRRRGSDIAMIFQEPMTALNPVMTIGRQVEEAAEAHSLSWTKRAWTGREAKRKAIAALESVAILDAAQRYGDFPHQFSGGQRQRILIAMALINKPRLLIADEPTTALDVTVQAQVLELLKDLQRQHGLAMLFISHDLAVVGEVASRAGVMRAGQVVETGPCARLLTAPEHPYTKSLLAAVPTLRTDRDRPLAMVGS